MEGVDLGAGEGFRGDGLFEDGADAVAQRALLGAGAGCGEDDEERGEEEAGDGHEGPNIG